MKRTLLLTAAALVATSLPSVAAAEEPGELDPTFGTGGVVTPDVGGGLARTVLVGPDGSITLAGDGEGTADHHGDFVVARLTNAGAPDPTLAGDGITSTDLGDFAQAHDALLKPDGQVVVVGWMGGSPPTGRDVALAGYAADGSLDPDFGTDGVVRSNLGSHDRGLAVALQSDGSLVVAGDTMRLLDGRLRSVFAVARYDADGSLDPAFGDSGVAATRIGDEATATAVAIQSDGRIVVLGQSDFRWALARYTPTGVLDATFGAGGTVIGANLRSNLAPRSVLVQPDGRILAAGTLDGATEDFAVARFTSTGAPDPAFGANGVAVVGSGASRHDVVARAALRIDGSIVVAGHSFEAGSPQAVRYAVARLSAAGAPDPTFGGSGVVVSSVAAQASGGALQPDGKIIVTGEAFTTARFLDTKPFIPTTLVAQPVVARLRAGLKLYFPTLEATLTTLGVPLPGRVVTFHVGAQQVCAATTGADGTARCTNVVGSVLAIVLGYTARFPGDADYAATSATGAVIAL